MAAERELHRSSQVNHFSPPRRQETKSISKRELLLIACLLFAGLGTFSALSCWLFPNEIERGDSMQLSEIPEEVKMQMKEYARMTAGHETTLPPLPLPSPGDFKD